MEKEELMRYYIADLHFFHEGLLHRMDNRNFETVEKMNDYMISQWNSKVRPVDEVVVLGDFSLGRGADTNKILERLNGKKFLIKGNHDYYTDDRRFDTTYFQWIEKYKVVKDNKRRVVLSHYPIFCYDGQYRYDKNGNPTTYMLYGHVHDTYDEVLINRFQNITRESERTIGPDNTVIKIPCQMINCFCMFSNYVPLSLDEWIENDRKRREKMTGE